MMQLFQHILKTFYSYNYTIMNSFLIHIDTLYNIFLFLIISLLFTQYYGIIICYPLYYFKSCLEWLTLIYKVFPSLNTSYRVVAFKMFTRNASKVAHTRSILLRQYY